MPRTVIRQGPRSRSQQSAFRFRNRCGMFGQLHYLAFRDSPDVIQMQPSFPFLCIGIARGPRECIHYQSQRRYSSAHEHRQHFPIRQQLFQNIEPHHSLASAGMVNGSRYTNIAYFESFVPHALLFYRITRSSATLLRHRMHRIAQHANPLNADLYLIPIHQCSNPCRRSRRNQVTWQ